MSRITTATKMLDRVAGEAKLYIVQDGERISDAFFLASMPVRGFEKLVLGRTYLRSRDVYENLRDMSCCTQYSCCRSF